MLRAPRSGAAWAGSHGADQGQAEGQRATGARRGTCKSPRLLPLPTGPTPAYPECPVLLPGSGSSTIPPRSVAPALGPGLSPAVEAAGGPSTCSSLSPLVRAPQASRACSPHPGFSQVYLISVRCTDLNKIKRGFCSVLSHVSRRTNPQAPSCEVF